MGRRLLRWHTEEDTDIGGWTGRDVQTQPRHKCVDEACAACDTYVYVCVLEPANAMWDVVSVAWCVGGGWVGAGGRDRRLCPLQLNDERDRVKKERSLSPSHKTTLRRFKSWPK